jgi:hypothetical protein
VKNVVVLANGPSVARAPEKTAPELAHDRTTSFPLLLTIKVVDARAPKAKDPTAKKKKDLMQCPIAVPLVRLRCEPRRGPYAESAASS